jgi:hypothetical protein
MFSSSSHLQINGDKFVNIGRYFNLEAGQAGNLDDVLTGVDFSLGQDSSR